MHSLPNIYLRLPLSVNLNSILAELQGCLSENWKQHFNTNDYTGDWNVISLRSASGKTDDITVMAATDTFQDTSLLQKCPTIAQLLQDLKFPKEGVKFMRLAPGSSIKEHSDQGLAYKYGCFRLHIPLVTATDVAFIVENNIIPMQAGECWYADFDRVHRVDNKSTVERIHLVIDGQRNEWTDKWFGENGYDFDKEKIELKPAFSDSEIDEIVKQLLAMNTEISLKMADEMLLQKGRKTKQSVHDINGSIPVIYKKNEFVWYYQGDIRYTEPFFHTTQNEIKRQFSNSANPLVTSAHELIEHSKKYDSLLPAAFIFHTSRSGSTLLTQMLVADSSNIVLSEVPVLNEILMEWDACEDSSRDEHYATLFSATVNIYSQRRSDKEKKVFIKMDSWHLFYFEKIRKCFPAVPVVLLFRNPANIVNSQQKLPGMQSIKGYLPLRLLGIAPENLFTIPDNEYLQILLKRYYECMYMIANADSRCMLLDYVPDAKMLFNQFAQFVEYSAESDILEHIYARAQYHSKTKNEVFKEEAISEDITINETVLNAYNSLVNIAKTPQT